MTQMTQMTQIRDAEIEIERQRKAEKGRESKRRQETQTGNADRKPRKETEKGNGERFEVRAEQRCLWANAHS